MRRRVCAYSPAKRLMNHPLLHMHHTQFQQSFLPSLHLLTWFGPLQTQPLGHLPPSLLFQIALWCLTTQHRSNKHVASCIRSKHYSWSQSCVGWPECQTNKYVWQCNLKHPCRFCMKQACTFHHGLAAVHICLATQAGSRHYSREVLKSHLFACTKADQSQPAHVASATYHGAAGCSKGKLQQHYNFVQVRCSLETGTVEMSPRQIQASVQGLKVSS